MIQEDWLPFVEKKAECMVKRNRADRGGKLLGAEMTAWLKKQGIQRELTTAYTPQSNCAAERANRTILETARALLIQSEVGSSKGPHAVRHATVARNRVLIKVGNKSWALLERWLGRKPPVDMLRVFGCMAVTHVPKKYRSKLGASAIWDVKFVEGMMYGGFKKQPETKESQQMEQITMQCVGGGRGGSCRGWTSSCDESLFLKRDGEKLVLFLVYVDDIVLLSSSMKQIQKMQQQLMKNFKCKTLGEVKYYLGMHVERDLDHRLLKLHQEKFIKELGEKYGIENERKVALPC
ncbi:unnamed protein product [Closterium sp. NIES-53]